MQPEFEPILEEKLLAGLQDSDYIAWEQFLEFFADNLIEYATGQLANKYQGKKLADACMGRWKEEKFARATMPLTRWVLNEIDHEAKTVRQATM